MQRTIRIELEVDVDGDWPGDEQAELAALAHFPSGVMLAMDDTVILINSMTAEVVDPAVA